MSDRVLPCTACRHQAYEHTFNGKCLFAPTAYTPMTRETFDAGLAKDAVVLAWMQTGMSDPDGAVRHLVMVDMETLTQLRAICPHKETWRVQKFSGAVLCQVCDDVINNEDSA